MTDILTAALNGARVAGPDSDTRCKVGRILDTVDPANRATIEYHLQPGVGMSVAKLAAAMRHGNAAVGTNLLHMHQRGECLCAVAGHEAAA